VSPILAPGRAGNFIRALFIILLLVLLMRTVYLMWFFRTPAWTSRPDEIRYCGGWYKRSDELDIAGSRARQMAGGSLKEVRRSPVFRPIMAYRPTSDCPRYLFARIGKDVFVIYRAADD
jgi:hypothetical protein